MRMICPNCGAQYEVDGAVIPEAGRDVQCSNCGHTWFQRRSDLEGAPDADRAAETPADSDDDAGGSEAEQAPEVEEPQEAPADAGPPEQTRDAAPEPVSGEDDSVPVDDPADDLPGDVADTQEPEVAEEPGEEPPRPQGLDKDVAEILRQEAARETAERSAEGGGLETQPDLGIDQGDGAQDGFEQRAAQLQVDVGEDAQAGARRDLLPDIEEINSTLAASSDSTVSAPVVSPDALRRSGFRRGFSLALVVFAVLALVYVFAPRIVDAVPQSATVLSWYVDWVNALRSSVDGLMQRAVERLTALLAQISGEQAG